MYQLSIGIKAIIKLLNLVSVVVIIRLLTNQEN